MSLTDKWEQLEAPLNPKIVTAIQKGLNFFTMMPVQKVTIPLLIKNYDVAIQV